ncbi:hypothetical protein [Actinotalea sp.]|uniref:hypothetical protein n=1 Tax=Actinotalea sp. TaxID=1872145 RepID=UPI003567921D
MTAPTAQTDRVLGHAVIDGSALGLDVRRYYRIAGYDAMPPFLMTMVGASDLWVFLSSTGGLTAGRCDADRAIFPYYTEDKVADGAEHTGGLTELRVQAGDGTPVWWRPFDRVRPGDVVPERNLYKDVLGTTIVFEESRRDLGLCVRVVWQTSRRYGLVRTCQVTSLAQHPVQVEVLDGLQNLLPAGATAQTQNELSVLLDAYKRSELDPATGLGTYAMSSSLTDLAEASESLSASVAWQVGLPVEVHLLSSEQRETFGAGGALHTELDVRGRRGAYLAASQFSLAPGERREWRVVADVALSAADVVAIGAELADPVALEERLLADVEATRRGLEVLLASTDAAQTTGDELAAAHHGANVLFNAMRGGVPSGGYTIDSADLRDFVRLRSPRTAERCAALLAALPEQIGHSALVERAEAAGDDDLWRLLTEYLPLTFSRRHGDPSRPWNKFQISLEDEHGAPLLGFQGNWRDIFQNWEALAWSFPEYVESMVAVFLDATTADGYNPYRISRSGIDWEVPEPENPWANIGYWSDHQIVYLLKLLETSERFHPGTLRRWVDRAVFTHADVPYRIASYAETLEDPRSTITFDEVAARSVADRVAQEGADGRLVHGPDGELIHVTLAEKLLVLLLAKVVNLVPEGGIWMNTQRPEWNDANNALVGTGLSVVTLAYLRRYVDLVRGLLDTDVVLGVEAESLLTEVDAVLTGHLPGTREGFDDRDRRTVVDGLGAAGTAYRARVYAGITGRTVPVGAGRVQSFLDVVEQYVDSGLRANLRPDGLVHAYNVLRIEDEGLGIRRLQVMLEGQVAVLSSGLLSATESLDLLTALRHSALYREDQHSYQLYPDRELPGLLEKNRVTPEQVATCPVIDALVSAGDRSIVLRDVTGVHRFAAGLRNARDVVAALDALAARPDGGGVVVGPEDRAALLGVFEDVFHHAEFTGRSGSFFAYEGLGSIYWHMVSKLLLAVQEILERAVADGEPAGVVDGLRAVYEDVRQGLGYCKSPEVYGAFPIDPYSHTPAGRGARQPGMTGQVKEEILTRLGELGLRVEAGRVVVRPVLLRDSEWTTVPGVFRYVDVAGKEQVLEMPAGSLAFTFCQVPVLYRRGGELGITLDLADGSSAVVDGPALPEEISAEVFRRTGAVRAIRVTLPTG